MTWRQRQKVFGSLYFHENFTLPQSRESRPSSTRRACLCVERSRPCLRREQATGAKLAAVAKANAARREREIQARNCGSCHCRDLCRRLARCCRHSRSAREDPSGVTVGAARLWRSAAEDWVSLVGWSEWKLTEFFFVGCCLFSQFFFFFFFFSGWPRLLPVSGAAVCAGSRSALA